MNESSMKLEQDVETSRAHLSETVDAIKGKMSTGQMLDEAIKLFQDSGGGEFSANLMSRISGNPIPLAMIGVGASWLAASSGTKKRTFDGASDHSLRNAADGAVNGLSGVGNVIAEEASDLTTRVSETAKSVTDQMTSMFESEPLIVAGLGFAVGAAIGSILPASDLENQYLGKVSDAVKEDVGELASAVMSPVKNENSARM